MALFVAAEYARGQAPNHTLLGLYLMVTLEVLPSIPQLADVLCTFSMNASLVGGSEQSFTDDAPLFPVLECHIFTLHSVIEVHSCVLFAPLGML